MGVVAEAAAVGAAEVDLNAFPMSTVIGELAASALAPVGRLCILGILLNLTCQESGFPKRSIACNLNEGAEIRRGIMFTGTFGSLEDLLPT